MKILALFYKALSVIVFIAFMSPLYLLAGILAGILASGKRISEGILGIIKY